MGSAKNYMLAAIALGVFILLVWACFQVGKAYIEKAIVYIAVFFVLLIFALGGLGVYYHGLNLYRIYSLIQYTPTSKAVSLAPGISEAQGPAQPHDRLKTAPYGLKPCVFYWTRIYKWSGYGKHRRRDLVKVLKSNDCFDIVDETGAITIRPSKIPGGHGEWEGDIYLKRDVNARVVPSRNSLFGVMGRIMAILMGREPPKPPEPKSGSDKGRMRAMLASYCPDLLEYRDQVDVEETYIEPGDLIYVLGTARPKEAQNPDDLEIAYEPTNKIFCVSDGSEKNTKRSALLNAFLLGFIGPIIFAVCIMLMARICAAGLSQIVDSLLAGLVVLLYTWFAATNLFELYNGTVRLRQNIEKAKANADALYDMRHNLLPKLVDVARSASKYEKGLQDELVRLRGVESEDALKRLMALSEDYPKLKASKNFLFLQKRLETVQERLAGSQAYLVDATTLYNARVQSFPYFLFTPLVGLRAMPMPDFSSA
ncbi:MAG: LemA family protein [Candidatus Micrarchaeota archaeon]